MTPERGISDGNLTLGQAVSRARQAENPLATRYLGGLAKRVGHHIEVSHRVWDLACQLETCKGEEEKGIKAEIFREVTGGHGAQSSHDSGKEPGAIRGGGSQ